MKIYKILYISVLLIQFIENREVEKDTLRFGKKLLKYSSHSIRKIAPNVIAFNYTSLIYKIKNKF